MKDTLKGFLLTITYVFYFVCLANFMQTDFFSEERLRPVKIAWLCTWEQVKNYVQAWCRTDEDMMLVLLMVF